MKGKILLLMALAVLLPPGLQARGLADVIAGLRSLGCYSSAATFSVTLPNRDSDVNYRMRIADIPAATDMLSPCSYLIEWELDAPSGAVDGWTAYFNGNFYRFRDSRIQEYHMDWDPTPFISVSPAGVQRTAQFADLLPPFIAESFVEMCTDSCYTVTGPNSDTCDGVGSLRIDAVLDIAGERVQERTYWFDAATFAPLRIDMECNPASITEQSISVRYAALSDTVAPPQSEQELMGLYPTHFEKYRESNFRIENLPSTPLPAFSLPTATGERYTHHRGEGFRAPTVVALIDPAASFAPDVVEELRRAVDGATTGVDVIWAMATTNADLAESVAPSLRPGEHLLLNARGLARDCGAASLPAVILADASGLVKKVVLGHNKDLASIVIQSIALIK